MAENELLSMLAYCIFLAGAARSFRTDGDRSPALIMASGIGLDVVLAVLPMPGITAFRGPGQIMNAGIAAGIALGGITWVIFVVALAMRAVRKTALFHALIAAVQVVWFIACVSFLIGMYKFA